MAKSIDPKDQRSMVKPEGVPSWLANYASPADAALKEMQQYRIVPRVKLLQPTTQQDLKEQFGEGSGILRPGDALLCKAKETFAAVPLFFYKEFLKWADTDDKSNPSIIARSYEEGSDIAKRARDANLRTEGYGAQDPKTKTHAFHYRYCEHLNFLCFVYGQHPLSGQLIAISFSRGEFGQGMNLINSVLLRKVEIPDPKDPKRKIYVTPPLCSMVFEFTPAFREKGPKKKWWGFDFNPAEVPYVKEDEMQAMQAATAELADLHAKRLVVVDQSDRDEDASEGTVVGTQAPGKAM